MSKRKIAAYTPFVAKEVKCFRIEQDKPTYYLGVPCKDHYEKDFATVAEAEKRARYLAKRFGKEADILAVDAETGRTEHVATALIDALGRCWTEVAAGPGTRTFL
jgi:hypothetical protein